MFPINAHIQKAADFIFTEPDPPTRFSWLYGKQTYAVRPERRGKNIYWYMRKRVDGQLFNLYLAPAGKLSAELLNNAARHILEE